MSDYKLGYEAGLALGCAKHGIAAPGLRKKANVVKTCMSDATFQKALSVIAESIFKKAGSEFTKEAAIYATIAGKSEALTKQASEIFLTPVLEALAEAERYDNLVKEASFIKDIVGGASSVMNNTQDALYKLALLGLIGGGVGGTLLWNITKDMREDTADAESKREQAKHYRRIAKDIQKRMDAKAKPITSKSNQFKKSLEEENESDYVL